MSERVARGFRWLGCADAAILARCPSERMRFAAMGGTVATTSVLATASAILTVHQFLHVPLAAAVLVGIGWGAAIMTLDRWLIMSIRRQANPFATLALSLPRVALAVIAGLVIAKPLVLIAFRSEVNARATADRQHTYLVSKQLLDRKYGEISTLSGQAAAIERRLTAVNTGAALLTDPEYRLENQQTQKLEAQAQAAQQQALCELDGTCGTRRAGAGPVYAARERRAAQLQQQVAVAQSRLAALRTSLLAQEAARQPQADAYLRAQLRQTLARLRTLQAERAQDEATLRAAFRQPLGLAERLDALGEVSREYPSIGAANLLLSLLILLIDAAPALGKAFMSIGRPTLYELLQEGEEAAVRERMEMKRAARLEADRVAARAVVDEAHIHREQWQQALQGLIAKVVETQRDVAERYIEQWERDARTGMREWIDGSLHESLTHDDGDPIDDDLREAIRTASRDGAHHLAVDGGGG